MLQGAAAQLLGILDGLTTLGGVDDVGVLAILDAIQNVRTALVHLVDQARVDARLPQGHGGAVGGVEVIAQLQQLGGQVDHPLLVAVANGEQGTPFARHLVTGTQLRLGIGLGKAAAHPHHLTSGAHLRPQQRIHARELGERQYHFLH